jgi:glucans biosynthesis protein
MDSDDHLYVIDFAKGSRKFNGFTASRRSWTPDIDVVLSGGEGKVLDKRVMRNNETGGWRAFFKLDVPEKTNLLEIMMELKDGTKVISERWMYQWRR